jgi:hypothetical protein
MYTTADTDLRSRPASTHVRFNRIINTRTSAESSRGLSPAMVPLVRPLVCSGCLRPSVPSSYTSDDPIGVELAGAMKNVYAIVAVSFPQRSSAVAPNFG